MKRYIPLIFTLVCLTGCRYTFELEDSDMKPMLAVKSCICADSTTVIEVHKTVPVTEISKADTSIINPEFSLRCNGKEVDATYEMIGEGGIRINGGTFSSGDHVELTFGADGMETIQAATTIPGEFPEYHLDVKHGREGYTTMKIRYEDDPGRKNYYGVQIWWKGRLVEYGASHEILYETPVNTGVKPFGDFDTIQLDPGAYSPLAVTTSDGYIYFWSDEDEEDDEYEVKFGYLYEFQTGVALDRELKCRFYSLSEEMYRLMFADYDSNFNAFASIGFSSPSFTYTNIKNGSGYFCGYRTAETEWFPLEQEEE